jgi:hypothetical protein
VIGQHLIRTGITSTGNVSYVEDIGNGLIVAAILAADEANYPRAMHLLGRVKAMGLGPQRLPADLRRASVECIQAARKTLGDVAVDRAWTEGMAMTQEQALAEVLAGEPPERTADRHVL